MIPQNVRDGAVAHGLTGETRQFTIAATREAFRTLIDGLYSNKVRAVIRELCSNAQDSQIEARQSRPFQVYIPTNLDPTFRVRDFGTSLSHDDVMGLYTQLFNSSRRQTNDATGMLGLGSKSPYALVDSFSVIAYMNGQRRVYLAFLDTNGVPSLSHISTAASNEPQGLEVSFAVDRQLQREFQDEMQYVAMGYRVAPEIIGMTVKLPKARMEGANWAIYPRSEFRNIGDRNAYVRQGSALYPSDIPIPNVTWNFITVIDIPIGTAEVAASREALAYTAPTRTKIGHIAQAAYTELRAQIDKHVTAAASRLEKARVSEQYIGILNNMRGFGTDVSLQAEYDRTSGTTPRVPGDTLESSSHFGKAAITRGRGAYSRYASTFPIANLSIMTILVNDRETKVVRRQQRVRNHNGRYTWVLDVEPNERQTAIAWIKECLELEDKQFILVSDLPDCPPVKKPYQKSAKRSLGANQYWMIRDNGCVASEFYGGGDHIRSRHSDFWPRRMVQAADLSKLTVLLKIDDVFWVTTTQAERWLESGVLDPTRKLDLVIHKAVAKLVNTVELDKAQALRLVASNVGRGSRALPVVIRNFFPDLSNMTEQVAQTVIDKAVLAQINLDTRPIVAKVNAEIKSLVDQYPLLFQRSDERTFEHYVKAVKASDNS